MKFVSFFATMISRCCTTYKLADLVYSGGLCFWGWISVVAIYAVTLLLFPHVWESSIVAVEERIMNEVDLDRSSGVVEDVDVLLDVLVDVVQ